MTSSAARRLARFVTDLALADVPPPVVGKAGLLVQRSVDVQRLEDFVGSPNFRKVAGAKPRPRSVHVDAILEKS